MIFAPDTAVFNNTPSAPNSIANAASAGLPIPASTITGTVACSIMKLKFNGFTIPSPDPIEMLLA